MWFLVGIVSVIAVFYGIRFYRLKANLKRAERELRNIEQNPEENRILLISFPDKEADAFLKTMNDYILLTRKERILYKNREKELRAQIENISHDLRTPLTAIIGYLELMERDRLCPEDQEAMEVIERKARSLQSLIGNFYDLSRLEMSDYHLSMEKMDVARFARETTLLSYQQFEQRSLSVELSLGEVPVFIEADAGAMERIFNNMLQNALRYAESFLRISICRKEGQVRLVFENDTAALKESDIPHLFERFYVQERSRTSQSTGLGLTINRLLAEAMDGSVGAELKEGKLRVWYEFGEAL